MDSERLTLRTRTTLDQWFVLVVVVLLAASAFGGWMAYSAYADDNIETDEQTVEAWSTTAGYYHSAEVQAANPVFEIGEVMANQQLYYTQIAPELEGEFDHRYDAPGGDVDVQVDLEQVIRSVDDDGGEYWQVSEPLNATSTEGLAPGDGHRTTFALDVPELVNESDRIDSSLGDTPGTIETVVVAHVAMDGTIDGEEASRTDRYELVLEPDGDTYTVDAPMSDRRAEERTEEVETAAAGGTSGAFGGLAVFVLSTTALAGLALTKWKGTLAPSAADLERGRARHERERFDDWITRGVVPDTMRDRDRVAVDTLEGLVDVAIDSDRRVIEAQTADAPSYWVLDGDLSYVYEPVEPVTGLEEDLVDETDEQDGDDDGENDVELEIEAETEINSVPRDSNAGSGNHGND